MIAHGTFKDFNNDTIEVTINNSNSGEGQIEIGENGLFFTGNPIEIVTNIDDTFEHIIKKSAQINLLSKNYVGDYFFADNARTVSVEISRNNEIIFSGYLEPNTFSQGYSLPLEEFTLNCTDYLSTLQYLNYNNATINNYDALKSTASNKSFYNILQELFGGQSIWYDKSKAKSPGRETTLFQDLGVNENYIYGEDFDDLMTQEELLNEMLQYLNLHIIQEGTEFYVFDWNTIKNERSEWVNIFTSATQALPVNHITMLSDHHADNSTNITIADVYNQIQVKCELENEETVIESPLDNDRLESYYIGRTHYMTEIISEDQNAFFDLVDGNPNSNSTNKLIEWYVQPMYNNNWVLYNKNGVADDLVSYDTNGEAINAYSLPLYAKKNQLTPLLLRFGSVENNSTNNQDNAPVSSVTMKDYLVISINGNADNTEKGASPTDATIQNSQPLVEFIGSNGGGVFSPSDEETTNYIVFSGKITLQPIQWESDHYNNVLTRTPSNDPFTDSFINNDYYRTYVVAKVPVDGGTKYYSRKFYANTNTRQTNDVVLNDINIQPPVKSMQFRFNGDKYGSSDFKYNYSAVGDGSDKMSKMPILECELIIGNKRLVEYDMDEYGNSKFAWTDINSGINETYVDENGVTQTYLKQTFSIGINPKIDDVILGTEFEIQNTIDYRMNIDAEGMAIPIKMSDGLSGAVIFRILGPINLTWNDITRRHPSFWRSTKWYDSNKIILCHLENIILSDFTAKIYTDGGGITVSNDKDLIYLSNENMKYYNKKDDITFKFVTQLTSKESSEKGVSQSVCLNAIIDMTTNTPITSLYNATTNETAKAEEHYVDQYYREYSSPKILMETTLHENKDINFRNIFLSGALNKTMYVQSINHDVREATATITLKEI